MSSITGICCCSVQVSDFALLYRQIITYSRVPHCEQVDPAAFKDLSNNHEAYPGSQQAPYHTAKHSDDDALQYNNSLSGVTGKVGAGGNNYSRPEGQNVRAGFVTSATHSLKAFRDQCTTRSSAQAATVAENRLEAAYGVQHGPCAGLNTTVACADSHTVCRTLRPRRWHGILAHHDILAIASTGTVVYMGSHAAVTCGAGAPACLSMMHHPDGCPLELHL